MGESDMTITNIEMVSPDRASETGNGSDEKPLKK